MSAPIPTILANLYSYALKANSSFPGGTVRELIERIASLEAQVQQLREALTQIQDEHIATGELSPETIEQARAALAATEPKP